MFKSIATHIAPFPSISDYSWNILTHAQKVHGKRGKIRSYEANYYNRDTNQLHTDPRNYFKRLGLNHHYFNGAFEHYLNPYIESLLYLPTEELPKLELKQIKEAIFADSKELVSAMVASTDALMHTRATGPAFLKDLNRFLIDIDKHYKEQGIEAEIIIVSDHGQAARFSPGEESQPLIGVDLKPLLTRATLNLSSSLQKKNDVVIPIMALGNYGTAYFKDPSYRLQMIKELQKESWFTLALFKVVQGKDKLLVSIYDQKGEAELLITRKQEGEYQYHYRPKSSNPLEMPSEAIDRNLNEEEAHIYSMNTEYPDSFHRIAFSAFQEESDFPDLLFTIKDEYYIQGELSSFAKMYQTHGSLSKRSSFGMVASTSREVLETPFLRTAQILPALSIDPKELYRIKEEGWLSNPETSIELLSKSSYEGIKTGSEDFSNRRIFELMNKAVHYSEYVFDAPTMNTIVQIVKPLAPSVSGAAPMPSEFNLSEMDVTSMVSLNDLASISDILIRTGDVEEVQKDPTFIRLKEKLNQYQDARKKNADQTSSELQEHGHLGDLEEVRPYADVAKKTLMKAYSSTFLLEKAMELPEFPVIADDRDLAFRESWEIAKKELDLSPLAPKLFSEVFTERQIAHDIAPKELPLLYNKNLKAFDDVTFVYIPGIYNSIFDNEIFKMGLDGLVNHMGQRVIAPPVFSACSSSYNGELIVEFLKADKKRRKAQGYTEPKYFILGYSKGGMDALHAFTKDPEFVRKNIHGLLTIASPLKGSSILNKSDLPFEIVHLLGTEKTPEVCITKEKASHSITPAGAEAFLNKEASTLIGLTRYYSVSFVEDIKDSHLFMKVTKNLARFGEPNDGVVPLSSSRFPAEFQAVDLGVIKGDHLSGIVASKFPQEAFMEAIVLTLAELDAINVDKNRQLNQLAQYQSKSIPFETHRKQLSSSISSSLEKVFKERILSRAELKLIEENIKEKLAGSVYETKDFSLVQNKQGEVRLVYSRPVFNNSRLFSFITSREKISVSNVEEVLDVLLGELQLSGKSFTPKKVNLVELTPLAPLEKFKLPPNELGYNEDFRINLRKLGGMISGKRVTPITPNSHKEGIAIIYNHHSSINFRKDYQFSFESDSPFNADDNDDSGWISFVDNDHVVAKLASKKSSIRLSTFAFRFLVKDFPKLLLDIQVNDDVEKADVLFGGSGKDDSAFQLWFTFRVLSPDADRSLVNADETIRTLGYYFGDEVPGRNLKVNEIYENYYSKKNFIIATLPESKQKLIGLGNEMLGKPLLTSHNLLEDMKKAFPDIDPEQIEILGITIQHDSNDTKGSSEAIFRSMKFQ